MVARAAPRLTIAVAALLLAASPARAQLGGSVSIASDNIWRGLSQSGGRPTLTLGGAYDHPSGVYLGGSAIVEDGDHSQLQLLGFRENLGFAFRQGHDLSWDIGVDNEDWTQYGAARRGLHYSEVYAGVAAKGLAAHLYYSPDYVRPGYSTLYAELSGSVRPADNWRLFATAGALLYLTAPASPVPATRYDARIGVARALGPVELKLEGTATTPRPSPQSGQTPESVVVSASYFF